MIEKILFSTEFWKFAAPLFGAVIAWFVNEWLKRVWEQYKRKEESYKELVRCLKGFYISADNKKELREKFLNQLNQCWLYCPDEVIKRGYDFLDKVHKNNNSSNKDNEKAMGNFVAEIRKDLLSRKLVRKTKLKGDDFKHLKAND